MGNVLKPLVKNVLIPLRLTAVDAGIHKENIGSGTSRLILLEEELKDIMKIVDSHEEFVRR